MAPSRSLSLFIHRGSWLVLAILLWSCSSGAAPASSEPPASATIPPPGPSSPTTPSPTSSGNPAELPTPTETSPAFSTPPPSPTQSASPDYFGRREEPPPGVEGSLFFSIPNTRPCRNDVDQTGPEVRLEEPALETPFRARACLLGFNPGEPIEVSLVAPGGDSTAESVAADESGVAEWWFTILPTGQIGSYEIVASQAQATVSNAVDVGRASNPKALALPDTIHPGERAEIWYDGLAGSSTTPAFLYTAEQGRWRFDAVLPLIVANESGAGVLEIEASSESPPGSYLVVAGPRAVIDVEP